MTDLRNGNSGAEEEDIMLLTKQFYNYLKKNKYNHWKEKGRAKNGTKVEPISYECRKPRHIKWDSPTLKNSTKKEKEEIKNNRRSNHKAFWINSDSKSLENKEKEDRCMMANEISRNSEEE